MHTRTRVLTPLLALALATTASAQLNHPRPPGWRTDACTAYAGFGTDCPGFTSAFGGPNDPDDPATTPGFAPTLTQLTPGAIVTSTCNIYNPGLTNRFELVAPSPGGADILDVVVQVKTNGNELDETSVRLDFGGGPLAPDLLEVLGEAPGTPEELLAIWDLRCEPATVTSVTIAFENAEANSSIDIVELDVRYRGGCEAGSALCFGDGTGAPCPCGNEGSPGNGCGIPQNAAGTNLTAFGNPSVDNRDVTFELTGLNAMGSPSVVMIRSTGLSAPATTFGDGLLCLAGSVVRVGSSLGTNGTACIPYTHGAMAGAGSFYYQGWFRSTPISFCDSSAAFNLTNGYEVVWP